VKAFEHQHPGEIIFGNGRISEVGSIVSRYGRRCLIVSGPKKGALRHLYPIVGELLEHLGLDWKHFDGVTRHPTVDQILSGAELAKTFAADVILGVGGGSSLDAAKAISIQAAREGTGFDSCSQGPQTGSPVVAVGTTAGSGSQVTPLAFITNPDSRVRNGRTERTGTTERTAKKTIGNDQLQSVLCCEQLIPRSAIVDPQLMLSIPAGITAATGFAVLCRALEAILNPRTNPLAELYGWEAIRRVINDLPVAVRDGSSLGARGSLAWADTLAGYATGRSGMMLPHGIAIALGSIFADVPHGLALASIYRSWLEFSWTSAVSTCATLAHLLDPAFDDVPAPEAAERCPGLLQAFLARVGLVCSLRHFGIARDDLSAVVEQSIALLRHRDDSGIPTPDQVVEIIENSF
jgi:alcohol dehydrogenase